MELSSQGFPNDGAVAAAEATFEQNSMPMKPPCDEVCQKKCDAEQQALHDSGMGSFQYNSNPMHDQTWNCKNNYNTFTTDYDPNYSHPDRMTMDVMNT